MQYVQKAVQARTMGVMEVSTAFTMEQQADMLQLARAYAHPVTVASIARSPILALLVPFPLTVRVRMEISTASMGVM